MSHEHERMRSFIGTLRQDAANQMEGIKDEAKLFALHRLIQRCSKKAKVDDTDLSEIAIRDFLRFNAKARRVSLDLPPEVISRARLFIEVALETYTSSYTDSPQCSLDMGLLASLWSYGPGASNGIVGTHFCVKVIQTPTTTERCRPFTRFIRSCNPYLRSYDAKNGLDYGLVNGSRITTVPKNDETDRVIAIEPLGNMMCQLAAGHYIEGALRAVHNDITTQAELNKHLALVGSRDDTWATLDLKHASDMIVLKLIKLLWPSNWYHLLSCLRSPSAEIAGCDVTLNMLSTMGNGFTFPVMTLTLLALCRAVCGDDYVGVFGDDIIIRSKHFDDVCTILRGAGLIVNNDKSFREGPFRESCGGDYYKGYDVTPFYVKSLATNADVYVAINQLLEYCGKHKICFHSTLQLLLSFIHGAPYFVPEWLADYSGIRCSEVASSYKCLEVQQKFKSFSHELALFCALGGYTQKFSKSGHAFLPRGRTKYRSCKRRLPSGWRTGRCGFRVTRTAAIQHSVIEGTHLNVVRHEDVSRWITTMLSFVR